MMLDEQVFISGQPKWITEVTSLRPANGEDQQYVIYVVPQVTTYISQSANKPVNVSDLVKLVNGMRKIKKASRWGLAFYCI